MSRFTCTLLTTMFLFAATSRAKVTASVIVQDAFTGTDGTNNNGRTPSPTDVPGGNWSVPNDASLSANTLRVGGNGESWISIASAGSYTKPTNFEISADLNLAGTAGLNGGSYGDSTSAYGINLGFKATESGSNFQPQTGDPGIVYTSNSANGLLGELLLINGTNIVQSLPTGFSSTGTYNLSYVVNTASGSISDVMFNGTPIAFAPTALFTDGATMWAGFYQRPNGTSPAPAFADNFTINSVVPAPEPVSSVLLGLGVVGLIPVALRRRRV